MKTFHTSIVEVEKIDGSKEFINVTHIERHVPCPNCDGRGHWDDYVQCSMCHGRSVVKEDEYKIDYPLFPRITVG